jgi:ABC-type polysaccharide/polyol phosphate transport system ATPase subunit
LFPQIEKKNDDKEVDENDLIICKNIWVGFNVGNPSRSLADMWGSMFSRNSQKPKFFWALKDISFSVKKGEIVGLIGNNGTGKTTLLRVIAGILDPDKGQVQVNTPCTLLSPGIGSRSQLSGRENIYLGCLYLGYSMEEIKQKYEEIVEFSGLREHIDRPVQYYSDGMISRLNFTIAASLKSEFLLLDELLSAGDITFRDKAARRMKEIVRNAKGTIIATHDMPFVRENCSTALYLRNGEVRFYGDPNKAVDLYENDNGIKHKG